MNGLHNDLYNVYNYMKTSKDRWDDLQNKYMMEDARLKKFIVTKFLHFKMVDNFFCYSSLEIAMIINDLLTED